MIFSADVLIIYWTTFHKSKQCYRKIFLSRARRNFWQIFNRDVRNDCHPLEALYRIFCIKTCNVNWCHMPYANGWFREEKHELCSHFVVFVQPPVQFVKFVIFIKNVLIYQHSQKHFYNVMSCKYSFLLFSGRCISSLCLMIYWAIYLVVFQMKNLNKEITRNTSKWGIEKYIIAHEDGSIVLVMHIWAPLQWHWCYWK